MKRKKIIFLNPPIKIKKPPTGYYHCFFLNILSNASVIKKYGLEVEIIDSFLEKEPVEECKDYWKFGSGEEEIIKAINKKKWDVLVIGYAVCNQNFPFNKIPIKTILKGIKKDKHQIIILADCDLAYMTWIEYNPLKILRKEKKIDFICTRETESKIVNLLDGKIIPGVAYKRGKSYFFEKSKGEKQDLIFDFDLIKVKKYLRFLRFTPRTMYFNPSEKYFPLLSSRNCPYQCSFCTTEKGRPWQPYPLKELERYIKHLKRNGAEKIAFLDPSINIQPERFDKILDIIYSNKLKMNLVNGLRLDLLNKELIKKMAKCMDEITVSLESGDEFLRKFVLNKRIQVEKTELLKEARRQNLTIYINYMIGLPGERKSQINSTLDLAWGLFSTLGAIPKVEFLVPIKGTSIYNQFKIKKKYSSRYFKLEPYCDGKYCTKEELQKFYTNFMQKINNYRAPTFVLNLNSKTPFEKAKSFIKKMSEKSRRRNKETDVNRELISKLIIKGKDLVLKKLPDLLKEAREEGFGEVYLMAEAKKFVEDEFIKEIADYNIVPIILFYSQIEKIKENFIQSLQGLIKARKYKEKVEISTIFQNQDYQFLEKLLVIARRLLIKQINIYFFASPKKKILDRLKKVLERGRSFGQEIKVFNLPYCSLPGYEDFLIDDKLMAKREFPDRILKVSCPRYKDKQCQSCVYNCVCSGKYKLNK